MDKAEARAVADRTLEDLRKLSYDTLVSRYLDQSHGSKAFGESGKEYHLKTYAIWDSRPGGDLRVWVDIDDGGWRSFSPLVVTFTIAADGSFVGE